MYQVKKIACIGNMNNMMLPIALYLKDRGYQVTLFLLNEFDHFMPNADTDLNINLEIIQLGWTESNFLSISTKEIKKKIKNFEFYIGTDYAPAFCNKANIKLDIFFPAGSDLYDWPFKSKSKKKIPYRWEYNLILCSKAQFYGIKYAKHLAVDPTNKDFEDKVFKIRRTTKHEENIPYHYLPFFENSVQLKQEYLSLFNQINEFEFKIIYHGRQEWVSKNENDAYKGNDIFLKGFKEYLNQSNYKKTCLILLEYGTDVDKSKQLIRELEIEENVIWLPKMYRKYLFVFIKNADLGVGMFGKSWYSSCAYYEIMMAKIPLISYRDDEYYLKQKYTDLYPLINVNTILEIKNALVNLSQNFNSLKTLGNETYQWFKLKQNKRIESIINHIKNKKNSSNIIDKVIHYPYYLYYLRLLYPISWLIEFINTRISK